MAFRVSVLARQPSLWPALLRVAVAFSPRGWWRRWPPDPRPPAEYVAFRVGTAYGRDGPPVVPTSDLVAWVRWCAGMRRCSR